MPSAQKPLQPKTKSQQLVVPSAKIEADSESTADTLCCEENVSQKSAPSQPNVSAKHPSHHQPASDQLKGTRCEGSRGPQVGPPAELNQENIIAKINEISEKTMDEFEKVKEDHDRYKKVLMDKLRDLNIEIMTKAEPSEFKEAATWIAENAEDSAHLYQKWKEDESQAAQKISSLQARMSKMRVDMEERRNAEVLKLEAAEQNKVRTKLEEQRRSKEKLETAKLADQKSRKFRPTETKPAASLTVELSHPRVMIYTKRGREEQSRWKEQRDPKQTPSAEAPPQTQKKRSAEKDRHHSSSRIPLSQRIGWSERPRKRRHSRSPARTEVRIQRRNHRSPSRRRESPKRRRISKSPSRRERAPRKETSPKKERDPKLERDRSSKGTVQSRRPKSPPSTRRPPAFQRSPKDSPKAKKEESLRTFPARKKQISKAERRMAEVEEEEEFFRMPELPFDKEKGVYIASSASFPTNDEGKWD